MTKLPTTKHLVEARNVAGNDFADDESLAWAAGVLAKSPFKFDRDAAERLGAVVDHGLGQNAHLFAEMQNGNGVALVVVLSAILVVTLSAAWLASQFLPL